MMAKFFVTALLFPLFWAAAALSALPALPGGMNPGQAPAQTEAVADTAVAHLVFPKDLPHPEFLSVLQDTVNFGGIAHLVLDFSAGTAPAAELGFAFSEDWVLPAQDSERPDAGALSQLPEPAGPRVVLPFRVYRVWPFRISSGSGITRVVHVRGKVNNLQDVAPIRAPLVWGMHMDQIILAAVLVLALVLLFFWLWRRRRVLPTVMEGQTQDVIAWPAAAVRLAALQNDQLLEKGETREFLSTLAHVARNYVVGRFFVGADEMTGKEIEAACLAQGYDVSSVRPFTIFIRRVDQLRYNPESPQPAMCRESFALLVNMIGAAKITSTHSPIPAGDLIAGQQAWAQVFQRAKSVQGGPS